MTELAGYWGSPWPAEDGGPTRRLAPAGGADPGLDLSGGRTLQATTRALFAPTMMVLREPGEVYVLAHTMGGDTVSWVERVHPESLETIVRSPDLAAGPFWPGGLAAHADGSLYVTYGRWCHRLAADTLEPLASRELPRDRPYNSFVVLPSGHLVMKDIAGGIGLNRLQEPWRGSELVVLEPGTLDEVARLELPEGSIARLSARSSTGVDEVVVVGESAVHRVRFDAGAGTLAIEEPSLTYRTIEGQTYGWDPVLAGGSAWFLDNGEGSEHFGGCYRGGGASTAPLHLVRATWRDREDAGGGFEGVELFEVCGEPGGVIANPPLVDEERGIVVGYDSGHGVMTAWSFGAPGEPLVQRWQRRQDHACHLLRWPASGHVLSADYDVDRGIEQAVLLDLETGTELARVDTASPLQSVLFPAPGWSADAYACTFAGITRLATTT